MDDIANDVEKEGVKELLCDDDLVLLGDSWEEVREIYTWLKKAMTKKCFKMSVKKTKGFL